MSLFSNVFSRSGFSPYFSRVRMYVLSHCGKPFVRDGMHFRVFSLFKKYIQTGIEYFIQYKMNLLILMIFMFGFSLVSILDLQTHSLEYCLIPFLVFMCGFGMLFKKYVVFSQKRQFNDMVQLLQNNKQDEYIKFLNEKIINITDKIESQLRVLKDKEALLKGQIGKLEQKYLKSIDGSESRTLTSNVDFYQPFNRYLNSNNSYTLESKWSELLGVSVSSKELSYIAGRIWLIETLSKGRLAAAIEDVVLRLLVCKSIANKNNIIVEIGSLFGIGISSIFDRLQNSTNNIQIIAIDPLDGYYGANRTDPFTGEFVEENIFHHNMRLIVPEKNYTLLKHLSTDQEAINHISKVKCDVLIIDGDHSYQGVRNDFNLYLPFVNKNGYIIFDDYNAEDWPEVREFVDKEVMSNSAVEFVGAEWRTAVFRVV